MADTLNNGQSCPASHDLMDKKNIPFNPLPSGTVVTWAVSDEEIIQFEQDAVSPEKGMVTTKTDKVGTAVLRSTMTIADGTVFDKSLEITVINSAPGTSSLTLGTPVEEGEVAPPAGEPPIPGTF